MKASDLKSSILQMAVQGKLVAQDPTDEPASVLLERISEERAKLIKEKKIKAPKGGESRIFVGDDGKHYEQRGKSEPVCIEDEIPFDTPNKWEWARLETIASLGIGKTPSRHDESYWLDSSVPWVSISDMRDGMTLVSTKENVSDKAIKDCFNNNFVQAGTLLMSFKLTIGKVALLGIDAVHNEAIVSIIPILDSGNSMRDYLLKVMPLISQNGDSKDAIKGTTLNSKSLSALLIPIPPLEEQKRIAERVAQLMPLVEEYRELEAERETLDVELPEKLRKSVLQLAVEGKLVPQDSADEPASVLLDRIREERVKLIKEKKIKAPKGGESRIFVGEDGHHYEQRGNSAPVDIESEIPFSIPPTWSWTRLENVCSHIVDGDHNPPPNAGKGIPILSAANVHDGRLHINEAKRWITNEAYEKHMIRLCSRTGCVLLTIVGTIGRTAIVETNEPYALQRSVCVIGQIDLIPEYVSLVLESNADYLNSISSGTAQKGVYLGTVSNLLMPIPPLAEQNRIANRFRTLEGSLGGEYFCI